MRSVLQDWVMNLGLRHQGVLVSCIRGCDSVPKEDPSKALMRAMRGVILHSFNQQPSSFIDFVNSNVLRERMVAVLSSFDHYPVHYIMHVLFATEIIAYKGPVSIVAADWLWFYKKLCKCFHVNPETEKQLDARLGETDEQLFTQSQRVDQ
jgi:hypothetical protein